MVNVSAIINDIRSRGKQENHPLAFFLLLKIWLVSYNIYLLICGVTGIYWMHI